MKKLLSVLVLLVITAVILTAGCTGSNQSANKTVTPAQSAVPTETILANITEPTEVGTQEPVIVPVGEIVVEKVGTTYNIGEKIVITLPSNPTTGYDWNITESEGLTINTTFIEADTELLGASGQTVFTISSEVEGKHHFVAKYMRSWEGEESAIYTFCDSIIVKKSDEEALTEPRCTVKYSGVINPTVDEYIKVTTTGNPTTGYEWTASGSEGLKVSEPLFTPSTTEMVGAGGVYEWLITADKAGEYVFSAEYKRSFEDSIATAFKLDLIFVEKVVAETTA